LYVSQRHDLKIYRFVAVNAIASSSSSSSYADKGDKAAERGEKEKSFAKMAHYLGELKRELDAAQKQRRDATLETQALRDKCQQLEDRLSVEQARAQGLEERLERARVNQRLLQTQVDAQNLKIAEQDAIISHFADKTRAPNDTALGVISSSHTAGSSVPENS